MKKETKAITIRIDKQTIEKYNEKLINIYGKNQRKKSTTIEHLLNQFNNQDTSTLKTYLDKNQQLLNLNLEKIQQYQNQLQEIQDENRSLKEKLTEKEQYITDFETLDTKEITTLNETLAQKEQIIQQLNQEIENKAKEIETIRDANQEKDKRIDELLNRIEQKETDIKTARNDFKHTTEHLNKLQNEMNTILNENKDYALAIAEMKNMSFIDWLFNRTPDSVKALPGNDEQKQ